MIKEIDEFLIELELRRIREENREKNKKRIEEKEKKNLAKELEVDFVE